MVNQILGPIKIQEISKLIIQDLNEMEEMDFEGNEDLPFGIQVLEKAIEIEDIKEGLILVGYFEEDLDFIIQDKILKIKNS